MIHDVLILVKYVQLSVQYWVELCEEMGQSRQLVAEGYSSLCLREGYIDSE
jgi:hypothetical protein